MRRALVHRRDEALQLAKKSRQSDGVGVIFVRRRHPIGRHLRKGRSEQADASRKLKAHDAEEIHREVAQGAMFGIEQSEFGLKLDETGRIRQSNLSFGFLTEAKVEAPAVAAKLGRSGGMRLTVNNFPMAT
ncbi:hypothetical protein [Brevundimonas diminuta]|jgi:hypothetical protein|uniref:hypothetical protein n=1 Tax=Brevundimonas diminuta TaxID=293 RepID=UPI00058F02D6|nr:hypothetical protein [Brevundimonas diminuta]OWR21763.1 hypothetical protein CD944_04905 [Brevundimonas diminuta]WQE46559.1 hypothetical protein U0020_06870 [Brevundimonas diminuta]